MKTRGNPISVNAPTNPSPQSQPENLQAAAAELRRRTAERLNGNLSCSSGYVREGRNR